MDLAQNCHYQSTPIQDLFGLEVELDLSTVGDDDEDVIAAIKADLTAHRVLLFRNQGQLPAETQLRVSRWFGEVHSTFYKHPMSPHPEIFRVSNDPRKGCLQVGRTGWHIDGTFVNKPFRVQTMHFWSNCEGGDTLFAPSADVIERLSQQERAFLEQIYFVTRDGLVHPLIYNHPRNGRPTFCVHCGLPFIGAFVRNFDPETQSADKLGDQETVALAARIEALCNQEETMFRMQWQEGDMAIIDNLAVMHFASPGTQNDPEASGLRILHRTTVRGVDCPMENRS